MIGGGLTFVILIITKPLGVVAEPIVAAPVSLILLIVMSLLTPPPSEETQKQVDCYHGERKVS